MNASLTNARNTESGFTLIELLVVILIIGILTAIAVPAFLNQRKKANDTAVKSDMKTVVTQVETLLIDDTGNPGVGVETTGDENARIATVSVGDLAATPATAPVNLSDGVAVTGGGNANGYTLLGVHTNGDKSDSGETGGGINYESANGGFVDEPTTP